MCKKMETILYFYPRPPRGGRPEEWLAKTCRLEFLSTPSARRATAGQELHQAHLGDFYPRPPRGGRRVHPDGSGAAWTFLSTPSARRATSPFKKGDIGASISIHALREEGDGSDHPRHQRCPHFYPRPPRGGRRKCPPPRSAPGFLFLSTPSARRATMAGIQLQLDGCISIHALREEGDRGRGASSR